MGPRKSGPASKDDRPAKILRSRLPEMRRKAGFTSQAALANHITKGINGHLDRPAIAKIESGDRGVSLEDVLVLAAALRCELGDLIAPREDEHVVVAEGLAPIPGDLFRAWLRGVRSLTGEAFTHTEEREVLQAFLLPALRRTLHELEEAALSEDHLAHRRTVDSLRDRTFEQQTISRWSEDADSAVSGLQEEMRQLSKKLASIESGRGAKEVPTEKAALRRRRKQG